MGHERPPLSVPVYRNPCFGSFRIFFLSGGGVIDQAGFKTTSNDHQAGTEAMLLKIILFVAYYFGGLLLALAASCGIGFVLCALLAIPHVFRDVRGIGLFLGYAFLATLSFGFVQLLLLAAGTLGDRTGYDMQIALVAGAIFPGVFFLSVIPQFVRTGVQQLRADPSDLTPRQ